ncbi:hypothetical protein Ahia01_000728100 [Argonauta hians]
MTIVVDMVLYDLPQYASSSSIYIALYLIFLQLLQHQTRSSSNWKLEVKLGKVVPVDSEEDGGESDSSTTDGDTVETEEIDQIMEILTNKLMDNEGRWSVNLHTQEIRDLNRKKKLSARKKNNKVPGNNQNTQPLSCGKPVNYTAYDHLKGLHHRHSHPQIAEPDVTIFLHKKVWDNKRFENKLLKARKEKPDSIQVMSSIGNVLRIRGKTLLAIECFRKVLSVTPEEPDVLLNLARLFLRLHYLDDAYYLTQISLQNVPAYHNSWLQHFTLGEIFKLSGQYSKANKHFQITLDLKPGFSLAENHLKEINEIPEHPVMQYVLCFFILLVCFFIFGVVNSGNKNVKPQRSFNRAMAMKSLKHSASKLSRLRR